jgi:hypothetical protein
MNAATAIRWNEIQVARVVFRSPVTTSFDARHLRSGRPMRVSVIDLPANCTSASRQHIEHAFQTTAEQSRELNGDAIIAPLAVGDRDGKPCTVSLLPNGCWLSDFLQTHNEVMPYEVLGWGARIASSLAVAHRQRLYHGALCPQTIWMGVDGQPYLIDFMVHHAATVAGIQAGLQYEPVTAYYPEVAGVQTGDGPPNDLAALARLVLCLLTDLAPDKLDAASAERHMPDYLPALLRDELLAALGGKTLSHPVTADALASRLNFDFMWLRSRMQGATPIDTPSEAPADEEAEPEPTPVAAETPPAPRPVEIPSPAVAKTPPAPAPSAAAPPEDRPAAVAPPVAAPAAPRPAAERPAAPAEAAPAARPPRPVVPPPVFKEEPVAKAAPARVARPEPTPAARPEPEPEAPPAREWQPRRPARRPEAEPGFAAPPAAARAPEPAEPQQLKPSPSYAAPSDVAPKEEDERPVWRPRSAAAKKFYADQEESERPAAPRPEPTRQELMRERLAAAQEDVPRRSMESTPDAEDAPAPAAAGPSTPAVKPAVSWPPEKTAAAARPPAPARPPVAPISWDTAFQFRPIPIPQILEPWERAAMAASTFVAIAAVVATLGALLIPPK